MYLQKVISRKTFFLISILLASSRLMTKIATSGFISQRHESAVRIHTKMSWIHNTAFNFPFIGSVPVRYRLVESRHQCSRSVMFLCGCGSSDPYTGLRIRIRKRLFSLVAFKIPKKNSVRFFYIFLLNNYCRYIYISFFLLLDGRIRSRIRTTNNDPDPEDPETSGSEHRSPPLK
jgi:hypothetical protein